MPVKHPECTHEVVVRMHRLSRQYADLMAERRRNWKQVAHLSRRDSTTLTMMNSYLFGLGYEPGQHVEVQGHLYKVGRNGSASLYVGQQMPDDTPREAYDALDAVLTREGEIREWSSFYGAATAVSTN